MHLGTESTQVDRMRLKRASGGVPRPYRGRLQPIVIRYALAAAAVAVALGMTLALGMVAPKVPNTFFMFAAIVAVAWFLGDGPGWFSVVLSTAAVDFFLVAPIHVLDFSYEDISWLTAFAVCAASTNAFSLRRRATEEELVAARKELEQRVRERTKSLLDANDSLAAETAERSRAEAALREARSELIRASRIAAVAELTASIAHEINQPLAAVVANGEAALNWLNRRPPSLPEVEASIAAAVTAGERAADVITRVRSLIARGHSELKSIDVNDLIRNVMLLVGIELARRDVSSECHYEVDLPSIQGDRVQLQQLVLNLVNNAMEAMNDIGGASRLISVRTLRSAPRHVRIVVEDSGQGLLKADMSRLFEPFYSTKEHGMGMGLSICRTIVESHGGTIRAGSGTRGGARFEVDLPAKGAT